MFLPNALQDSDACDEDEPDEPANTKDKRDIRSQKAKTGGQPKKVTKEKSPRYARRQEFAIVSSL